MVRYLLGSLKKVIFSKKERISLYVKSKNSNFRFLQKYVIFTFLTKIRPNCVFY